MHIEVHSFSALSVGSTEGELTEPQGVGKGAVGVLDSLAGQELLVPSFQQLLPSASAEPDFICKSSFPVREFLASVSSKLPLTVGCV